MELFGAMPGGIEVKCRLKSIVKTCKNYLVSISLYSSFSDDFFFFSINISDEPYS